MLRTSGAEEQRGSMDSGLPRSPKRQVNKCSERAPVRSQGWGNFERLEVVPVCAESWVLQEARWRVDRFA